jgi:hypothetical protein
MLDGDLDSGEASTARSNVHIDSPRGLSVATLLLVAGTFVGSACTASHTTLDSCPSVEVDVDASLIQLDAMIGSHPGGDLCQSFCPQYYESFCLVETETRLKCTKTCW